MARSGSRTNAVGGRRAGVPNYKNSLVYEAVETIRPVSMLDWSKRRKKFLIFSLISIRAAAAEEYQILSGESMKRDPADFKRNFWQKVCNKGIRPTGDAGNDNSLVMRAQRLYQEIMDSVEAQLMGMKKKMKMKKIR